MTVTDGGGSETDGGDFFLKETEKTLTFECVRQPFFSNRMSGKKPLRMSKYYRDGNPAWRDFETDFGHAYTGYMNNGHVARKWMDGTWTIYPEQCGMPHFLEPIPNP